MTDVIMPQMGESIAEGTITKWMKKVGDRVQRDEPLFEISTDKVDAEIPAPAAGVLKEIRVEPGSTVPINTVVAIISEGEAAAVTVTPGATTVFPALSAPPPAAAAPPPSAPGTGADSSASRPAASAPAAPASTPSSTPAPPPAAPPSSASSPASPPSPWPSPPPAGPASSPLPPPSSFSMTAPIAALQPPAAAPPAAAPAPAPAPERARADMTAEELRQTRSSPVVRKIAAEHNVDIRQVSGTGIAGRVTKQDILDYVEGRPVSGAPAPPPAPPPPATPLASPLTLPPTMGPLVTPAPAPSPAPAPPAPPATAAPTATPPYPPVPVPPAPTPAPAPAPAPSAPVAAPSVSAPPASTPAPNVPPASAPSVPAPAPAASAPAPTPFTSPAQAPTAPSISVPPGAAGPPRSGPVSPPSASAATLRPAPSAPPAAPPASTIRTPFAPSVPWVPSAPLVPPSAPPAPPVAAAAPPTLILPALAVPAAPVAPAPSAPGREAAPPAAPFVPPFLSAERVESVRMTPIRKKTAEHMVMSKRISAHVTTVSHVDMTRVAQLRDKYRPGYQERAGIKLTYMPFIVKATVDALKAFPILNAAVDGDNIVYKKDLNIGMAVALDWGLIVPVLRNADEKNVLGLARAIGDLAERARGKKLKIDEIQGGTFTITNPGVFGSLFGTPIINQPQVGILGVGTIEKRPIVRDDAIAIRTMCYFALSFDHRIVDGADADRFMAHLKKGLQEFDESAL